eukprot:scaffold249308_cov70-Cyclotella_meneghiniana.AAC.10
MDADFLMSVNNFNALRKSPSSPKVAIAALHCRTHGNSRGADDVSLLSRLFYKLGLAHSLCSTDFMMIVSMIELDCSESSRRKRGSLEVEGGGGWSVITPILLPTMSYNGMILKDSHAEVLARRSLMAVLWNEITISLHQASLSDTTESKESESKSLSKNPKCLLEMLPLKSDLGLVQYRLRTDISLHMYISDSPCGDATIYEIKKLKLSDGNDHDSKGCCEQFETEMNFTGAKLILDNDETEDGGRDKDFISDILTVVGTDSSEDGKHATNKSSSTIKLGREHTQQLGVLRLKSSRSNIPSHLRSTSMSCADKLVRWGLLGLQGTLLASFIPEPICLSSICVSKDPRSVNDGQFVALSRALKERISHNLEMLRRNRKCLGIAAPHVAIVDPSYENSKSVSEYRHMKSSRKRSICDGDCEQNETPQMKKSKIDTGNKSTRSISNHVQSEVQASNNITEKLRAKKESPSGMSINWYQSQHDYKNNVEITIGATGLKRGKKPKFGCDVKKSASRLCRYNFISQWKECVELSSKGDALRAKCCVETGPNSNLAKDLLVESKSYVQTKQKLVQLGVMSELECIVGKSSGALKGWVRTGFGGDFTT